MISLQQHQVQSIDAFLLDPLAETKPARAWLALTSDFRVDEWQRGDVKGIEPRDLLAIDTRNLRERQEGLPSKVVLKDEVVVHDREHQGGAMVLTLVRQHVAVERGR